MGSVELGWYLDWVRLGPNFSVFGGLGWVERIMLMH